MKEVIIRKDKGGIEMTKHGSVSMEVTSNGERRAPVKHYLMIVWGDVEPSVRGPFETGAERDAEAKRVKQESWDEGGIYPLDLKDDGTLETWAYASGFFEEDEA